MARTIGRVDFHNRLTVKLEIIVNNNDDKGPRTVDSPRAMAGGLICGWPYLRLGV
jgi:hypothetical protein